MFEALIMVRLARNQVYSTRRDDVHPMAPGPPPADAPRVRYGGNYEVRFFRARTSDLKKRTKKGLKKKANLKKRWY